MGRLLTKKGDSKLYAGLVTIVKFLNENSHYHICLSHLLLQVKGQGEPFHWSHCAALQNFVGLRRHVSLDSLSI